MPERFVKRSRIEAPADVVFNWHMRPEALVDLTPPWERVVVRERTAGIDRIGSRVTLVVGSWPLRTRWVAEHTHFEPGRMFRDVQVEGPFARWEHTHTVEPDGPDACWLEDSIDYDLPLGWPGRLFGRPFVRRKLKKMFDYRHRATARAVTS